MEFGLQFFPVVGPEDKPASQYWAECLHLTEVAEELGYTHVRTVEHHFQKYGGYSPSPHIFLTAASMKTKNMRLVSGAVQPVFNNPLKIAGEIGMLDAISGGRLECGFARAFLPVEFDAFNRPLDESKARFSEGIDQFPSLLPPILHLPAGPRLVPTIPAEVQFNLVQDNPLEVLQVLIYLLSRPDRLDLVPQYDSSPWARVQH